MSISKKIIDEVKVVGLISLFFAVWFGMLILLKRLILEQYQIAFYGMSLALLGALVTAKVVAVLEHVPLGNSIRRLPAIIEVLLRTCIYTCGVLFVLLLEKAFEVRHEAGGFWAATQSVFSDRDVPQVWATTIGVSAALLLFNVFSVLHRHFGGKELKKAFFAGSQNSKP